MSCRGESAARAVPRAAVRGTGAARGNRAVARRRRSRRGDRAAVVARTSRTAFTAFTALVARTALTGRIALAALTARTAFTSRTSFTASTALAALAALACLPVRTPGQEQLAVPVDSGREVVVYVEPAVASSRQGGFTFVTVRLENRDPTPRAVDLELASIWWRVSPFVARRRVELGARSARSLAMPLPSGDALSGVQLRLRVEGAASRAAMTVRAASSGMGLAVLCVSEASAFAASWQVELEQLADRGLSLPKRRVHTGPSAGGRAAKSGLAAFTRVLPAQLPDQWSWLTAFDAVLVDGAAVVSPGAQAVLVDYVAAGGSLLVANAATLPHGPLAELLGSAAQRGGQGGQGGQGVQSGQSGQSGQGGRGAQGGEGAQGGSGQHGFGRWLVAEASERARIEPWLRGLFAAIAGGEPAGGVPAVLHVKEAIPGLGDVPVRTFFSLIVVFALLVGPVNHFVVRRRRRPELMLLTVPAAGLGFTAVILLYAFLSEGLGIQGVVRSVSVLDQRRHQSVCLAGRTLYAGLSPPALAIGARSCLSSLDLDAQARDFTHAMELDLDRNRLSGAILPSRLATSLVTADLEPCRERLRFRRRGDGDLELLAGPSLAPAAGGATVLLRAFDGRWFLNEAGGRMRPAAERDAAAFLERVAQLLAPCEEASATAAPPPRFEREPTGEPTAVLARALVSSLALDPGSYLALVQAAPGLGDLDLEVEYLRSAHVVKGLLAEADFVE